MRTVFPNEIAYFDEVVSRYDSAASVSPYSVPGARAAHCHENAELLAHSEPDCYVVRGWLIAAIWGAEGHYRIVAHSVNRRGNALLDVTPLDEQNRSAHRFVEHRGSEAEFAVLRVKFPELFYPIQFLTMEQMNALHVASLHG
jgi:hypothetical protein